MIFDQKHIPFILAGQTTTTTLPATRKQLPRKNHTYPIRKRIPTLRDDDGTIIRRAQIKTTAHRVRILDITPHPDGWHVTFEIDKRPIQEPPRLLRRGVFGGYTSNPAQAIPHEPEAVDRWTLAAYATGSHDRLEAQRTEETRRRQARSRASRLRELETRAHNQGIDIDPDLHQIDAHLDELHRKVRDAA